MSNTLASVSRGGEDADLDGQAEPVGREWESHFNPVMLRMGRE